VKKYIKIMDGNGATLITCSSDTSTFPVVSDVFVQSIIESLSLDFPSANILEISAEEAVIMEEKIKAS
jgi:hypothetical protein